MSELKVGDKRKWNSGGTLEILAIGNNKVFYRESHGYEGSVTFEVIMNSTPYTEPAPVQKIVAHVWKNGEVYFSYDNSNVCQHRDGSTLFTRIPFELGGGA